MDIYFTDPTDIPLPPDDVRILALSAEFYPDGRRVKVFLEITPFQNKPNGDILITDQDENIAAITSFIGAVSPKMEMTMHLRTGGKSDHFRITTTLYYNTEIDESGSMDQILGMPEKKIVDQKSIDISL